MYRAIHRRFFLLRLLRLQLLPPFGRFLFLAPGVVELNEPVEHAVGGELVDDGHLVVVRQVVLIAVESVMRMNGPLDVIVHTAQSVVRHGIQA